MNVEPWYRDGLRFGCTGCGKCCKGKPGYVWLTVEEMGQIAQFLKMPLDAFCRRFIRRVNGAYSLTETGPDFACAFLHENRCSIYPVRPKQCRTFPFWGKHLAAPASWEALKQECEGIDASAPLIPLEEIRKQMHGS